MFKPLLMAFVLSFHWGVQSARSAIIKIPSLPFNITSRVFFLPKATGTDINGVALDLVDSSTITYCTFNGTITGPTHGIMDSVSSEAYSFNSNYLFKRNSFPSVLDRV